MLDYSYLEALNAVAREKSFLKAAESLFITQSAVSQRIKALENSIGQPLLIRSPSIRPTAVGQQVINHFRKVSLLESELTVAWDKLGKTTYHPISIALNTESLSTWFIGAIQDLIQREKLMIALLIDDQERTISFLRTGKAWGCVTSVKEPPHGCTSTYLGDMVYCLAATPTFVDTHFSKGINGKALLDAPAAIYGEYDDMHDNYLKQHFRAYKSGRPVHHYVPSPEGLVEFTLKSMAFALLPYPSIKQSLENDLLVDLLPDKHFELPLYWQTQELQTDVTARLSKAIINHAKSILKKEVSK